MNSLRLHPDGGGPPITIEQEVSRVGRDSGSDVHLRDVSVSRQHAVIEKRGEDWTIFDLDSSNGLHVDGQKVKEATLLPGQRLHIGNLIFRVEVDRGDDGATMVFGRSPILPPPSDQTLLSSGPPVFPAPAALDAESGPEEEPDEGPQGEPQPEPERPRKSWLVPVVVVFAVGAGLALAGFAYRLNRRPAVVPAARMPPRPLPTPTPTATPEPTTTPTPTVTPTPTPHPKPTGLLLVSSDIEVRLYIDGGFVAVLKAGGLRRLSLVPGEHLVQFRSDAGQSDVVARVRVNEQTVVRRGIDEPSPR